MAEQNRNFRILRRPQVEDKTGLSRSSIYQLIAEGSFPPPIKLGPRMVGWDTASVDRWIEQRITESRKDNAA